MNAFNQIQQFIQSTKYMASGAEKKLSPQHMYQALFDIDHADSLLQRFQQEDVGLDDELKTLSEQIQQMKQNVDEVNDSTYYS